MNLQLKMNVNHILLTPKTIGVVSGFVLCVQIYCTISGYQNFFKILSLGIVLSKYLSELLFLLQLFLFLEFSPLLWTVRPFGQMVWSSGVPINHWTVLCLVFYKILLIR